VKFSPKEVRSLTERYVVWVMRSPELGPLGSTIDSMPKRDWARYVDAHTEVIGRVLQFLESEGYSITKRGGGQGG
jgi:hypothetical protein